MSTRAYKFLAAGARGPFSGVAWPAIGAWLASDGPVVVGKRGAHVCRADQLAHWLHEELWQVELDGVQLDGPDCVVAERARLLARVDAWSQGGAVRFARACVDHARIVVGDDPQLADADEALRHGYPAVAAYAAAVAVARGDEVAYARERARQSEWIIRELVGAAPSANDPL